MRLALYSALASAALAIVLALAFWLEGSVMAAAQAADSGADMLVALGLLFALWIARRPADGNHHFGHGQAEPIAALVAALIAAQLGIEVIATGVGSLLGDRVSRLATWIAVAFAAKLVIKLVIAAVATRRRHESPVIDALAVDARNDVLVGAVALIGFAAVNAGWPWLDAVLGLAVGALVFGTAVLLAVRNVRLLMGVVPPAERLEALRAVAGSVDGVACLEELRARETGNGVEITATVAVRESLTVADAHSIADAVQRALEAEPDVRSADIHLHPAPN